MLNLRRTLKTGNAGRALFSSQVSTTDVPSVFDDVRHKQKPISREEINEYMQNRDPSGFKNEKLESIITAGPESQERTDFFHSNPLS